MVRRIVKHGRVDSLVLDQVAHDALLDAKELKLLVRDMIDTMQSNQGMGLAAPQIGVSKRVIVWEHQGMTRNLINPVIKERKFPVIISGEGCLSVPGLIKQMMRFDSIVVSGHMLVDDSLFYIKALPFKGIESVIVQHEIDHLDGRTIAS